MQIYYPELTLAVNEPFQIENPYPDHAEGPVLATFADGLHLILYSNDIAADLPIWGQATLAVALSDFRDIPFICLTFQNSPLTLLYTMNVFKMIGDERGPWLRSISRRINFLLIDNQNGKLACIREMDSELLAKLRHICREQVSLYANAEAVETEIERMLNPPVGANPVTAHRVYQRAKLSNLVAIQYATPKLSEQ
ncbi:hypothetical protein [Spirosoma aerolatum]|uniref:hypothetical protein n=1 Tax=Spirosoma aerolatum TaxID=1211326 RepID=UPI0009AC7B7B|nr:hypothetical protein [Spirosoma aerolatum]